MAHHPTPLTGRCDGGVPRAALSCPAPLVGGGLVLAWRHATGTTAFDSPPCFFGSHSASLPEHTDASHWWPQVCEALAVGCERPLLLPLSRQSPDGQLEASEVAAADALAWTQVSACGCWAWEGTSVCSCHCRGWLPQ